MVFVKLRLLKLFFLAYVDKVFGNLKKNKNIFFKDLKYSGVSRFSFWAIEAIRKDGNNGKFTKPPFSGKLMSRVLFS